MHRPATTYFSTSLLLQLLPSSTHPQKQNILWETLLWGHWSCDPQGLGVARLATAQEQTAIMLADFGLPAAQCGVFVCTNSSPPPVIRKLPPTKVRLVWPALPRGQDPTRTPHQTHTQHHWVPPNECDLIHLAPYSVRYTQIANTPQHWLH